MLVTLRAQPPSCYGTLVKREKGDSKEEVSGSNPCGQGGEKMPSSVGVNGRLFDARGRMASVNLSLVTLGGRNLTQDYATKLPLTYTPPTHK
eukprot:32943-Pelagomonas_calceolata.AAC.1